jgi:hypothetical protein
MLVGFTLKMSHSKRRFSFASLAECLFSLTQSLLQEYPVLRNDTEMMNAFIFLMNILEAVSKETAQLLKRNQMILKNLLEVSKSSEEAFDDYLKKADQVSHFRLLSRVLIASYR